MFESASNPNVWQLKPTDVIPVVQVFSNSDKSYNNPSLWKIQFYRLTGIEDIKPIGSLTCDEYIEKYLQDDLNEEQLESIREELGFGSDA